MIKNPRKMNGEEIRPVSLNIDLEITPLSTANITLPAGQTLEPRTYIELFSISGSAGIFRTRSPAMGVAQTSSIPLDHAIAEAGDYVIATNYEQDSTVGAALTAIWSHYKGDKWQLGTIASASTAVTLETGYDTVLDAMLAVLEQTPNLMLSFDFSTSPWTVNVVQRDTTVTAEGRISRNVKSATVTVDDSELCTRVYMENLPGTSGDTYGHIDADTISLYGLIETELSGAETQAQALRMANAYLDKHKHPIYSVEIEGIELSQITGESLDSFAIGKKYRLALPKYGVVVEEVITAIRYSNVFMQPQSVSITLSEEPDQVINYIKRNSSSGKSTKKLVEKKNKEYETKFEQTDQYIYQWAGKTDILGNILHQAGMELDAEGVLIYATDNENNVGSKLKVNSDAITAEVTRATTAEGTLSSQLTVTANAITAEVTRATTAEGELSGRLTVTSEAITAEVTRATTAEGALSGRLDVTAEAITAEVTRATNAESSLSGRITVNSDKVAIVVEEKDGQNVVKAASIVTAINAAGSSVGIDADHVFITGTTKLSGQLTVQDGSLLVKTALLVSGSTNGNVSINNGTVSGKTYQVNSGGEVKFIGSGTGEYYDLTTDILKGMIKSFSVSGNTLTLTPFYGNAVTFSKATALNGAWDSGIYTVTASPQGTQDTTNLKGGLGLGTPTKGTGNTVEATYDIGYGEVIDGQWRRAGSTGQTGTISLDASGLLENKGTITANGTYTPSSGKLGISSITVNVSTSDIGNARARFGAASGSYYTEAYDNRTGNSISGSSVTYKLATSGSTSSTKVQIQDGNGTRIADTAELNVGSLYTDGQNSVDVTNGGWTTVMYPATGRAKITFSPSEGTGASQELNVAMYYTPGTEKTTIIGVRAEIDETGGGNIKSTQFALSETDWSSNKKKVQLKPSALNDVCAELEVDASSIYNNGVSAEKALVRTRFGSASGSYYIEAYENTTGAPSISNTSVSFKLGTSGSTSGTVVQVQNVSGTQISNTPTLSVGSLYTSGQEAVTLASPTWTGTNSSDHNTIRVSTSGRPTQLNSDTTLYITAGSWGSGSINVYIRDGSTSGTVRATKTITESNASAGNIKSGVTICGVTGTYSASVTPSTDISINNPTWYDSTASLPSVDATLNTMGSIINSHKNGRGYVYFNVTIAGVSGQKKYRIPIGT